MGYVVSIVLLFEYCFILYIYIYVYVSSWEMYYMPSFKKKLKEVCSNCFFPKLLFDNCHIASYIQWKAKSFSNPLFCWIAREVSYEPFDYLQISFYEEDWVYSLPFFIHKRLTVFLPCNNNVLELKKVLRDKRK